MTNAQIIKSKGYKTKRIETSNYKGIFGGTCNHVIALINSKDEVLHLEDVDGKVEPYFPCGRSNAYASLIKSGTIDTKYFSWKSLNSKN
jgi:hypothetical protein